MKFSTPLALTIFSKIYLVRYVYVISCITKDRDSPVGVTNLYGTRKYVTFAVRNSCNVDYGNR